MKTKDRNITEKFIEKLFIVSSEEAYEIHKKLERLVFETDECIITAGEEADGLYFIEEGRVTVFNAFGEPVNEMGAGNYFGEYAILADEPRMTTVKAHGKVVAYRLCNEDFLAVIAKHPKITGRMLKQVYGQISDKHAKLVSLTRKNRGVLWSPTEKKDHDLKSILSTYVPTILLFLIVFLIEPYVNTDSILWQVLPVAFLMIFTLRTKRTVEGLLLTVLLLGGMLGNGNFVLGFKNRMVEGIGNPDTSQTIVIMAMVESAAALLAAAGVVTAFKKLAKKYVTSGRKSLFGMLLIMVVVCLDECLNVITAGFCLNEVSDKNKVPRETRAILGSFSMAICSIIPFSLWSSYIDGWVNMYVKNGGSVFLKALMFNLAGTMALIFALLLCFGVLPKSKLLLQAYFRVKEGGSLWPEGSENYFESEDTDGVVGKPRNLLLPMLVWIVSSIVCGIVSSDGDFALDALSGLVITLIFMFVLYVTERIMTPKEYFETMSEGIKNALMPILLLVFAERIAAGLDELGFVSLLERFIPKLVGNQLFLVPMLLFVLFFVICAGLGSCWGTFGLAIPITIYLATRLGLNIPLCLGATLAAGVVGEALCPYIDESGPVVTSIGCEPNVYRKLRTQYWIPIAALCAVGYLILGAIFQ